MLALEVLIHVAIVFSTHGVHELSTLLILCNLKIFELQLCCVKIGYYSEDISFQFTMFSFVHHLFNSDET